MSISSDEFSLSAASPAPKKARAAKRPDPIAQAAESMVRVLEAHRDTGSRWLTRSRLIDQIPDLSLEMAEAALKKVPAKGRIVVAQPEHSDGMWLLKEDLESLSRDESFLRSLVTAASSAETPVHLLTELTKPLEKTLKKLIDGYWPLHTDRLPSGLSPKSIRSGKKTLLAIHDERFPLPEVELSQRLIDALRSRKESVGDHDPISWQALLQSIESRPSDDLIRRAILADPFAIQAKQLSIDGEMWVALTGDVPSLIASDSFLQRMIQRTCNAQAPEIKLSTLAKKLSKDLQQPFIEHWLAALDQGKPLKFALLQPAGTTKKRDVLIRDGRFPAPEIALAESFINVLQNQKKLGEGSYPTSWKRLLALAGATSATIRDKAIKTDRFQSQVLCSVAGESDAPLVLVGDESLLAESPAVLVMLLKKLRTDDNQLVPMDKLTRLKGIHPAIKALLPQVLQQTIQNKSLPAGVGALVVGKKSSLFLLADVVGIQEGATVTRDTSASSALPGSTSPAPTHTPDQFAHDFDKAFATLDGKLGLPNYASLVDLRPLLAQYPRDVFDRELLKLRRSGHYSLSLVEGRFGLSDEERAACLVVDHVPHLLVQKKR